MTTQWNNRYFAADVPPLTLRYIEGDAVTINISAPDGTQLMELSEIYAADPDGYFTIYDVDRLAMKYLDVPMPTTTPENLTTYQPWVDVSIVVSHADESSDTYSTRIYRSSVRTSIADPSQYKGFLTRYTDKPMTAELPMCLSCRADLQVKLGVTYVVGNTLKYTELTLNTAGQAYVATHYLPTDCLASLVAHQTNDDIDKLDIINIRATLLDAATEMDSINFRYSRSHKTQSTVILFLNCFGCLEAEELKGEDTSNIELEGEQAYIGGKYRRSWSQAVESHEVVSGHLTREQVTSFRDIADSEWVMLINTDGSLEEITLTDVDIDDKTPRTEPVTATITYRRADGHGIHSRQQQTSVDVFDGSFDETFE